MANFEKVLVPPLFDFDGFDSKVGYQMVPVGEARAMSVVADAQSCTIVVDPPGIARMRNFVFAKPAAVDVPGDLRAKVPSGNQLKFEIFGEKNGNTTIFLVDPAGKATEALLVSVKGRIAKTVALCRLSDIKRNCPFRPDELPVILNAVDKVFTQQANIQITQHGRIFDVTVPQDLGNPLILEKAPIRSAILNATPNNAFLANLIVYFTWDIFSIKFKDIVGVNFGIDCYVEFQSSPFERGITTAHEIGHGLGLGHTGAKFLMAGDGEARSSNLQQFEIDTINTTDRGP